MVRTMLIACSLLTLIACAPDDDLVTVKGELANWQSDWSGMTGTQPWVCSPSTYNPMTQAWPTVNWCQWMPPSGTPYIWRASNCSYGDNIATIKVFEGTDLTGRCMQLWGTDDGAQNVNPYYFNTDFIRVNGLYSSQETGNVKIRSMRIPPHTRACVCDGPMGAGDGPAGCSGRKTCWTTGANAVELHSIKYLDDSIIYPAAISVGHGI